MPAKASSPTKNKGKLFFVAKSSGPLLGRQPIKAYSIILMTMFMYTCIQATHV